VSATIETRPELPRNWIENALSECAGGRLSDLKLLKQGDGSFLFDKTAFRSAPQRALGFLGQNIGIDLTAGASFWQEWAELLTRWSQAKRSQNPK
jgi:hypothetical protein